MNILVTGVAGLVGSNLADWIVTNTGHRVIGVDDLSGGYREYVNDLVYFYDYNILDDDIEKLFESYSIDGIFHLAAYAAEGLSPFVRQFNYMNNIVSTSIRQGQFTKFQQEDGTWIMVNDKNVLCIEVFKK